MRRRTILLGAIIATVLAFFAWVLPASAQTFRTGDTITISSNQPIDSTLFAAGSNVNISTDVKGDVFCAGQTVTISGTVNGDVICAAQTLTVSGTVKGDIRLAGQTVVMGANVSGNATIAGQTVTLQSGSKIGGDLSLASASASLNGTVARDAAITGQSVILTSDVGRNVTGTINKLVLSDGAHIGGSINYTSMTDLQKADGAQVDGKITRSEPPQKETAKQGSVLALGFGLFIYSLVAMILMTLVLTLLFPQRMDDVTDTGARWPWWQLLTGLVAGFVIPLAIFVLAITIIGLPVAIVLGLMWLLVVLLSGPVTAYYLGRHILRGSRSHLVIALAGAALLTILLFIPFLGSLIFALTIWLGSGLILTSLRQHWRRPVYQGSTIRANKAVDEAEE